MQCRQDPRHPTTVCRPCFKGYVEREIQSAKLYVKCPCCPRALQTRELRGIVGDELHMQLVRRIAEAEQAHVDADAVRPQNLSLTCVSTESHRSVLQVALARKLDLRRCPECSTIIEKNEGKKHRPLGSISHRLRCPHGLVCACAGCSSMACYLCGNTFTWSTAKRVKKAKGKKKGATAAALPEGRAGSPGGEEEAQARTSLLVRRRMPIVSAVL